MKRRRMEEVREGEVQTEQERRSLRRRVVEGRNREEQEGDEKRKIGKRSGKMKKKTKGCIMRSSFSFVRHRPRGSVVSVATRPVNWLTARRKCTEESRCTECQVEGWWMPPPCQHKHKNTHTHGFSRRTLRHTIHGQSHTHARAHSPARSRKGESHSLINTRRHTHSKTNSRAHLSGALSLEYMRR